MQELHEDVARRTAALDRLRETILLGMQRAPRISDEVRDKLQSILGRIDDQPDPQLEEAVARLKADPELLVQSTGQAEAAAFELLACMAAEEGDQELYTAAATLHEDVGLYRCGQRRCCVCHEIAPLSEYGRASVEVDGSGYKRQCRLCEATGLRGI